jgi:hypothetical protein
VNCPWFSLHFNSDIVTSFMVSRRSPTHDASGVTGRRANEEGTTMNREITIRGKRAKKGERMTGGTGWRLVTTRGSTRVFAGTLLKTFNHGKMRLAVFRVPK